MIIVENEYGTIKIADDFFVDLVQNVISESFGIERTVSNIKQRMKSLITQTGNRSGVIIERSGKDLFLKLHVEVKYGVNINEAIKNLVDKIKYTIESYDLDVCVKNIDVCVDKMNA
ncbi:MAG: Asp23/Gls24 family envelope stress response protein [Oscillospiraceae bacterium]|nr:Asp23/Gls24 family envelope stress response protein [Oscillospiraceae bacterium]